MEDSTLISTGSIEIDRKLGGGVPTGSLLMVEGTSSSGKSSLIQQFLWSALTDNHTAAIYISEQTIHSLITQMEKLGLRVLDDFLLGRLDIYPVIPSGGLRGTGNILKPLLRHMETQISTSLLVVDSLTTIMEGFKENEILEFLVASKKLCDQGQTIIWTYHADVFDRETTIKASSICDAYLKLKVETVGSKLYKTMDVAKIRGAAMPTGNVLGFEIEPERGLKVIPISLARA